MKKSPEQIGLEKSISDLHNERVTKRATIRKKIQDQYDAELAHLKDQIASQMVRALDAGTSKSQLGRLVGTTNWQTIQTYLEQGRKLVPIVEMPTERFTGSVYMRNAGFFLFATVTDRDAPRTSTVQGDIVEGSVFKLAWSAAAKRYTADPVALDGMDENTDAKAWLIKEWAPEYYEKAIGKKGDDA